MAYKNKKKNKRRQAEIRKANRRIKNMRKQKAKDTHEMTENDYLRLMRGQGLI